MCRDRTPSPTERTRGHEPFRTPDSKSQASQRLSDEPEAQDIEAADILTELSGSFNFPSRRNSPGSVRQPAHLILTKPSDSPPSGKVEYNWGAPSCA